MNKTQKDKYKDKSCWAWQDSREATSATRARKECEDCSSKKCNRRVPLIKKTNRVRINRERLIEQITERLHSSATQKETFNVSNIILKTNFSTRKYCLVSRL